MSEVFTLSGWAEWVQSGTGRTLTPFQARAVDVLCCGFGSPWNCPWQWQNVDWNCGTGISVCARGSRLATFDSDGLTRLVIAAHEECVRVEISPATPRLLRVTVHPRGREGGVGRRHPTIEEAIVRLRPKPATSAASEVAAEADALARLTADTSATISRLKARAEQQDA